MANNPDANKVSKASNNALSKLRASVLGANDGIVSTAGLVLGVSGAAAANETILLTGFAGLVAGALSMAAGEFVSVSSQRDSEKAFLRRTEAHIKKEHASSTDELIEIYLAKGVSLKTATQFANEIQDNGSVTTELQKELGIDASDIVNPWAAAVASAISFVAGAAIPLIAVSVSPPDFLLPITGITVLLSLVLTGTLSARVGQANRVRAAIRIVAWGVGAMAITYAIGLLIGSSIG